MRYRGIVLLKAEGHSVSKCCELLKISCSGFYEWHKRRPSKRAERDGRLKAKIISLFDKSRKSYGSPRIQKCLQKDGEQVGKDKVAKLMKEEGLIAKKKKAFRPKTTINNPSSIKSLSQNLTHSPWPSKLFMYHFIQKGFLYESTQALGASFIHLGVHGNTSAKT